MTTPPNQPGIQISFEQLYSEVRLLHDAMTRIETKLDSVSSLEPRVRELERHQLEEKLPDVENRLRALEERRLPHSLLNVLAAVFGTAALVWTALVHR
jgi:hypothetical protein